MLYIGLGFLITWLEIQVFGLEIIKSMLVTAIIFIILGLLTDGLPTVKNLWSRRA